MNSRYARCLAFVALAAIGACAAGKEPRASKLPEAVGASSASVAPAAGVSAVAASMSDLITQVAVLEPDSLAELEANGFDFAHVAVDQSAATTAELRHLPALRDLFATLQADVGAAARPYPLARVTSIDGFRLFDARWLDSTE